MTLIRDLEPQYFIPHRAVLLPTSTTIKLCVVFNASDKPRNQKSLNDVLMVGPVIQPDLFKIILLGA